MGRAGPAAAGLQPIHRGMRYPGTRRCCPCWAPPRARRRLRPPVAGMRPRPGLVADKGSRPAVLLVVSVALAVPGPRTGGAGPPPGPARQVGDGPCCPGGWGRSPSVSWKTHCGMRLPCAARPWAASRSAASPPRWRPAWESQCWNGFPMLSATAPESHPWRSAQRHPRRAKHRGLRRRRNQVFAQVQAALNTSVGLNAVPSNLTPSLADTSNGEERACGSTVACGRHSKADSPNVPWGIPVRRKPLL